MEELDGQLIKKIADQLPEPESREETIFDIIGAHDKETANSNFLAYYLNPENDHGLGDLFFKSLLDLINKYSGNLISSDLSDDFFVQREASSKNGSVDIKLESNEGDWAIIIENKIKHHLHNDLQDYLENSNKAGDKQGIVLTLHPVSDFEIRPNTKGYINLTHQTFVNSIKENLPAYYDEAKEKHLLLIKEYFNNINHFYKSLNHGKMDQQIITFNTYRNEIQRIEENKKELFEKELPNFFAKEFDKYGFWKKSNKWHFYPDKNRIVERLDWPEKEAEALLNHIRIFIGIPQIINELNFSCSFIETYNKESNDLANKVKERLKNKDESSPNFSIAAEKNDKQINHIYQLKYSLDIENFTGSMQKEIEHLFKEDGPVKNVARSFVEIENEK